MLFRFVLYLVLEPLMLLCNFARSLFLILDSRTNNSQSESEFVCFQ